MTEPRRLPGQGSKCRDCDSEIHWATTVAGPNGPGGKHMPLDPIEHPTGNVALRQTRAGAILCRVLAKDDDVDRTNEYRAMPHFATCPTRLAATKDAQP